MKWWKRKICCCYWKTGWTQANSDDSFLVIDKNNNGNIDDITEMFGSATIPGFVELKKYDSNGDNLINASDSQFNLLRLTGYGAANDSAANDCLLYTSDAADE